MKILAVETATLTGSVALLSGDRVLGETTLSVSAQHSERLMPAIAQLLRDADVSSKDIDLYAVSAGPGSFTGLRIGLAAVQGFSLAHGKPVVGVSTLEAMAHHAFYFPGLIVPMLNAFRGEVYWAGFHCEGAGLVRVMEDRASSPEEIVAELRRRPEPVLILGNGTDVCGDRLLSELGQERIHVAPGSLRDPRAVHVAFLAAQTYKSGLPTETVLPRYLRKPG